MSYIENGKNDLNGLHKSSSLPSFKPSYSNKNNNLYNSSKNYPNYNNAPIELPKINNNQYNKDKIINDELDRSKKIKEAIQFQKNKFSKYRGLPEYTPSNIYNKHSRHNFSNPPHKTIEDKNKDNKYLHNQKDLSKLMLKINYDMHKKIDENSDMINRNLNDLEKGYNELKSMIQEKMNKLEKKQKQDFYKLNIYIENIKQRNKNIPINKLSENGQNYDNDNNNYFSQKIRQENLDLIKTIKNLPNLLDKYENKDKVNDL